MQCQGLNPVSLHAKRVLQFLILSLQSYLCFIEQMCISHMVGRGKSERRAMSWWLEGSVQVHYLRMKERLVVTK